VGVAEIAELDVGTSVVHDWRYRHSDFPQPVVRLRMGLIWAWADVKAWAITRDGSPKPARRDPRRVSGSLRVRGEPTGSNPAGGPWQDAIRTLPFVDR
jgi:hypothetical protein